MFASQGFAATSVRELVEGCGCTKPALYYHFDNKVGLFRAAVETARERLQHINVPLESGMPFDLALTDALSRLRAHAEQHPDDLRLLMRIDSEASVDPELLDAQSLRSGNLLLVGEMIQAGIERGDLRSDLPVESAAIALVGMMHVQLQMWLDGRPFDDDFVSNSVSLYMNGVSA